MHRAFFPPLSPLERREIDGFKNIMGKCVEKLKQMGFDSGDARQSVYLTAGTEFLKSWDERNDNDGPSELSFSFLSLLLVLVGWWACTGEIRIVVKCERFVFP